MKGTDYGLSSSVPWSVLEHLPIEYLHQVLAMAREIPRDFKRSYTLFRLYLFVPEGERPQVLQEALVAARGIESEGSRSHVLPDLTRCLATFSQPALIRIWLKAHQGTNLLHTLAGRTRKDLYSDLDALSCVISALGDVTAIEETFRAVQDVARWWP
jgi:hypothetical protein